MGSIFFENWYAIFRVFLVTICIYVFLVILLRVSGKRTLSKMNAFDFVVTIAMGSTFASSITAKDFALADAFVSLFLLACLQWLVAWLTSRSSWMNRVIKSEPRILFYRGDFLMRAMQAERVAKDEILAAIRSQGIANRSEVEAVVLESAGKFSVIKRPPLPTDSDVLAP